MISHAAATGAPLRAKALVNAAGPWVDGQSSTASRATASRRSVRLVKGSHIIVPKVHSQGHALHPAEPRQARGLRDPVRGQVQPHRHHRRRRCRRVDAAARITEPRRPTTCSPRPTASSRSRSRGPTSSRATRACARSTTTAPTNPSEVTRDYVLKARPRAARQAPLLTVFGGKITTYRRLAEEALAKLRALLPGHEGRRGPRPRRCPAATCAHFNALPRRDARALPDARARPAWRAWCAATAAARRRSSATRERLDEPRPQLRRRAHRARDRVPAGARSGPRPPRTCCGGAPSAACTWTQPSARPWRASSQARPLKPLARISVDGSRRASAASSPTSTTRSRTHGQLPAVAYARARAPARRRPARDPRHGPPRRLVRPHRAHVAGGRGRGRERRLLVPPRRARRASS